MQITVKAHFNKQSKDSKKELIQFYVKGDDEKNPELNQMTREVVELQIEGVDQKLTAEFNKTTKDSKKTVLDFVVKGDTSADQSFHFYKKAGSDISLIITESQMSIEEFNDPHEGVQYSIDKDGTATVTPDQMSLDDVEKEDEKEEDPVEDDDLPFGDEDELE